MTEKKPIEEKTKASDIPSAGEETKKPEAKKPESKSKGDDSVVEKVKKDKMITSKQLNAYQKEKGLPVSAEKSEKIAGN